jgi:hypothetical protein
VPFPGFQEVQLEKVGKDPLTELDLLNDGSSTLIVSDFSYAIVNGEIPLATFDFNPSGLSNFVGTLSVPPGGMTQVFQNVNIDDDQFLVFQGRLSDTSTFAVEQRLSLVPAPSSGWLLALGLLLVVGRVTYMRRSAMSRRRRPSSRRSHGVTVRSWPHVPILHDLDGRTRHTAGTIASRARRLS